MVGGGSASQFILSDTVVLKGGNSRLIGAVLFIAKAAKASFGLSS